jgi:hypothetical protein
VKVKRFGNMPKPTILIRKYKLKWGVEGGMGERGGDCIASALQDGDYLVAGVGVSARAPPASRSRIPLSGLKGIWPLLSKPAKMTLLDCFGKVFSR